MKPKFGMVTCAAFVLAAGAAAAMYLTIVNQQWGFGTTYPSDWVVRQGTEGPVYVFAKPPAPETLVNCATTAEKIEPTTMLSQTAINAEMATPIPREVWQSNVFGRFKNVVFDMTGTRLHPSGVMVQEAVASYDETVSTGMIRAKTRTTIFVTPGATFSISCNALASKYGPYAKTFAGIVDSFRPKSPLTAEAPQTAKPVAQTVANVKFDPTVLPNSAAAGIAAFQDAKGDLK